MIVDNPSQCLSAQPNAKPIGSMRINYIIYFYLPIILFTPAYTYHMAVKNKQEPPFPHATVTNTACHYPQAQIFRWTMTSAGAFLTLIGNFLADLAYALTDPRIRVGKQS